MQKPAAIWPPVLPLHYRPLIRRIIPPLQSRTVIVTRRSSIAGVAAGGGSPQTGLVRIFRVDHLVAIFDRCEARFDFIELRGSHNVLRF